MTDEEINWEITQILRDVLGNDELEIARGNTAADYLEWDSLAQIDFIVAIEHQFRIKFTLQEIESLVTIGDMLDLVEGKTAHLPTMNS